MQYARNFAKFAAYRKNAERRPIGELAVNAGELEIRLRERFPEFYQSKA